MNLLKYIEKNTLLIIPNNIKEKVLNSIEEEQVLVNIKIMSLEEIKKELYFDYDERALLFIMDNYNFNADISKTILNLLYYVDDKNYTDEKLRTLKEIKENLTKEKLLIFNPLFKEYLKKKKIVCYGYSKIDKFSKKILNDISCEIIEKEIKNYERKVYVLNTLEEEVEFVFNEISKLIHNGISLNNIKLANTDNKYFYTIKRFSKLFNIPVRIDNNCIYSSMIGKTYLSVLKETESFEESLNYIKENFDLTKEENNSIYNILFNVSNTYNELEYSFNNIYQLVEKDIKNSNLKTKKLENEIEIVDIENNCFDNEYVFLLGFNQGSIPKFYKDEEYLSDLIKGNNDLLIDTTLEKNILSKESVILSLNKIKNLVITAKEKSIDSEFMISNLANELNFEIVKPNFEYKKSYSEKLLKINLTKYLDDFIKYGTFNNNLGVLYNNLNINYLCYNNKFTGIDNNLLLNKLKPKLTLSYTHIDNYFHCAFKYYLTNILKLDKYEENFSTVIGNLFHYILSVSIKEDFDFNKEYDEYINNLTLTNKEIFFLKKLKVELELVLKQVKELYQETGLTKLLLEHKITIDKSSVIPVSFVGIVDKIMYKDSVSTLVSIVDYKTGNADINLYNVLYGLSMQLPVYLYLVKKSNLFNNVRFTGFYLQKILSSEVTFSPNKTYLEQKMSNLKLEGYSNNDPSVLEVFIPDYENSKFVKSMKTTSKGFYHFAKVLSDEQIDKLIEKVDQNIETARDNILKGDFSINPKQINEDKVGCNFCKFKDICYRTNNDFVKLKENKSLSFLGGEDNA